MRHFLVAVTVFALFLVVLPSSPVLAQASSTGFGAPAPAPASALADTHDGEAPPPATDGPLLQADGNPYPLGITFDVAASTTWFFRSNYTEFVSGGVATFSYRLSPEVTYRPEIEFGIFHDDFDSILLTIAPAAAFYELAITQDEFGNAGMSFFVGGQSGFTFVFVEGEALVYTPLEGTFGMRIYIGPLYFFANGLFGWYPGFASTVGSAPKNLLRAGGWAGIGIRL